MATNGKTNIQNILIGLIVSVVLFSTIIILTHSIAKILIIITILILAVIVWRISSVKLKAILKYTIIFIFIFLIGFVIMEAYLFHNAGYPPSYSPSRPDVTLSIQGIQNISLTKIVQDIESTSAFNLLRFEHGDEIALESLKLEASIDSGGYIRVDFASRNNDGYFQFSSRDGAQYNVQAMSYTGHLMSQIYPSEQTIEETLKQIDNLGISWFYIRALEIAQNRTNMPSIDSIDISLTYGEGLENYRGITLQIIGYHLTSSSAGISDFDSVLISAFEPDGNLVYMSKPP